jgi:putative cardiolipin synthase
MLRDLFGVTIGMADIPRFPRVLILGLALAMLLAGCGTTVDWDYPRTVSTALDRPETTTVGALLQDVAAQHAGQSGFALVTEDDKAFAARLAMADLAEKTLDAQYYIWDVDTTGRILADRLVRAADRGVRVRLLLDDHYQNEALDYSIAVLDAHPNIEVRFFNPVENRRWRGWSFLSDFGRVNHRMHNKLFIMDNALGITGGRNIADTYFGVRPDQNFRDLDLAMAGPVVEELSAGFDRFWNSEWSVPVGAVVSEKVSVDDFERLRPVLSRHVADTGFPFAVDEKIEKLRQDLTLLRDAFTWAHGQALVEDPTRVDNDAGDLVITSAIIDRLGHTDKEVLIESPYFILLDRGIDMMRQLNARGVTVRVLTNSAATNDVMAAHAGYATTRKSLLESGVALYEFRPDSDMKRAWSLAAGKSRAALHSKALVFDRETIFLGSFNFDPRSRFINTEIGVMIDSPALAAELATFMDGGVAPGSAFHLSLNDDGDIVWTADTNGKMVEYQTDPDTSIWRRFLIDIVGLLPIEEQL